MEKKQLISVVKPLIAAALLFGSSGGVAWGQILYPYGSVYTPNTMCAGTSQAVSHSFSRDNNFGPGEGYLGNPFTVTNASWSAGNGIITVGGTQNVVRLKSQSPIFTKTVGGTQPRCWSGTSCYDCGTWRDGASQTINAPADPSVPDGSGLTTSSTPTYPTATYETHIKVQGSPAIGTPLVLQQFYFMDNPWYYNEYQSYNTGTQCWSNYWSNAHCNSGGGTLNLMSYTITNHQGGFVDGRIELIAGTHVRLNGAHGTAVGVHTIGIGSAMSGSSNAHLILPSTHYSLMNDHWFDEASISAHGWTDLGSGGGSGASDVLGVNAVLGIQEGYSGKNFKTNTSGGTILIGDANPFPGQGNMEIQASTANSPGNSFGFSGSGNTVYTAVCVPSMGTANLGNYSMNPGKDVYVTAATLPTALTTGGLQIFNTRNALHMDKAYTIAQGGSGPSFGHLLMMAHTKLNINKTQTLSSTTEANTNLMGGDITFGTDAAENFTGSGSGNAPQKSTYSVVAFGSGSTTPSPAKPANYAQVTFACTPNYTWCNPTEQNTLIGTHYSTAPSTAVPPATVFQPFTAGVTYGGNCHTGFSGSGNIIYNSTGAGSTVTLSNKHSAQWQAKNDITITSTGKSFGWSNSGSGFMQWVAGNNINIADQTTANWTASGAGAAAFWRAGNDISLGNTVTASWSASGAGSVIGWQAGNDIKSGNALTANWQAGGSNARVWWEAGHDINIPNATALNWSTNASTGHLRWLAKNDIIVTDPTSLAWTSTGATDSVWWEAGHNIIANNTTGSTFSFTQTTTGVSRIRWQAGNDIQAKGPKTFTSNPTGGAGKMIWRAGQDILTSYHTAGDEVKFIKQTQQADLVAWQAGNSIGVDTKTTFENQNAANTTNMEWFACQNITTHTSHGNSFDTSDNFPVIFTNKSKGDMIWHAQNGTIRTNSRTSFINDAGNNGDMTWYAGTNIETHFGKDGNNQNMGEGVLFQQKGKGKTAWFANNDIKTYNTVHFDWANATDDATPITWLAKHDIIIGGDVEVAGNKDGYSLTVPEQAAAKFETAKNNDILLKSHTGMIQTNSKVDFLRTNPAAAVTKLWAGCNTFLQRNNIDIENEFNYKETTQADKAFVHLYAENDIKSNDDAASTCDTRPAPILFDISGAAGSMTRTLWEAERNINTRGRVDFNYKGAIPARALVWLSRAGYIQTERPVTVAYEGNDTVSFRAEDWRHDPASDTKVITNANDPVTGGRRGNIHFFDSINIKRYNTGVGVTEIKAENHIWTAMVDYWENSGATANKMDIISHKGDIYLGYNNGAAVGYSHNPYIANQQIPGWKVTQKAPSFSCVNPSMSSVSYDENIFKYYVPATNTSGHLWIKAGWEEKTDRNSVPDKTSNSNIDTARASGGNIYFTHINVKQETGSNHPTVISIPHSGLWLCGRDSLLHNRRGDAMEYYENAGIISGVRRCLLPYPDASITGARNISDRIGLIYRGAIGDLTVDAGNRGNIIFNKGAYLSFEDPSSTGNVVFRTRFGDIDMRTPFDVDTMHGSLLFLAQIENIADLEHSDFCGCKEERNNVYLQDFEFKAHGASGSVFVGADNNIKLNYGGLQNIGTRHDPFLSKDYTPCRDGGQAKIGWGYDGTKCGDNLHCDAIESENKARPFLMKFDKDANGTAITKGGFAAVASDYIDVYKRFAYYGGSGSGMGSVPGTGTLHGETVTGYGLFMKTQANKGNWNVNIFENTPTCPTPCDGTNCGHDYLHMVSRMTFHDDAYIEAQNQEVMLWSPVIETFGDMTLDSEKDKGSKTEITLKADSLIFHSDFIKKGKNIKLSTWSGLHNDLPIMKFGHMRKTPPFIEAKKDDCGAYTECVPCYRYIRFSKDPLHMLDTITIKFGDDAYMERLNTVIFDHTVLTCLTDSFDHVKGGAVQNAQIRTDTFKIRNQVDLFADEKHERDAHLELISEEQMGSKDYAGIYTKHLHMEPIGACGTPYSELWTSDDLALDVITTSIFGGFGFIHSDVHVENGGHLNAGFTSLRLKGMCYEQMCGTQRMKDLRLDVGAQLHFSVGTSKGLNGEYSDAIEVDRLTTYGSVDVNIEIRPCEKIEKRCYPIIYYKSVTPNSLNQLKLNPRKVKIDGEEYPLHLNLGTDGVVYVCVGDAQPVDINRTVTLPSVSGVKTDPVAGIWDVKSRGNFKFKATYSGSKPLAVRTNRTVNGVPEMLTGTKNANGEYEYIVPNVQQDITLSIGPDYVSNQLLAGTAVWSHGEMIYIRVDRADIASIYSVAGQLVRKVDLPEGDTSIPMSRGAYVITLKDGSVHKVIVK